MWYEDQIMMKHKPLTEKYLSSGHPLPWDIYEMTREEELVQRDLEIQREVIESEL
jgi:hypothetical protein